MISVAFSVPTIFRIWIGLPALFVPSPETMCGQLRTKCRLRVAC
jgi:hypothetical protein